MSQDDNPTQESWTNYETKGPVHRLVKVPQPPLTELYLVLCLQVLKKEGRQTSLGSNLKESSCLLFQALKTSMTWMTESHRGSTGGQFAGFRDYFEFLSPPDWFLCRFECFSLVLKR